jgi:hypothetical protein
VTSSEPPDADQPSPASPSDQPGPPPPDMAEPAGPPPYVASEPPPSPPPSIAGPPPAATGVMQRPGMVTGAGITMIVLGALIVLFGLIALVAGAFVGGAADQINIQAPGFGGMAGAFAGVIIVFALILLGIGILDIVSGANVLGRRSWARITGIVLAAILGLLSLPGLFGGGDANRGGGIVVSLILVAANAFIIWALATTGSWFAARAT